MNERDIETLAERWESIPMGSADSASRRAAILRELSSPSPAVNAWRFVVFANLIENGHDLGILMAMLRREADLFKG